MIIEDNNKSKDVEISVYADERKNINNRWNYMCLVFFPTKHINEIHDMLTTIRRSHDFDGEMKFSTLNKKGIGTKLEIAKKWLNLVIDNGVKNNNKIYFKIMGIDTHNLDFSAFGFGSNSHGKYANVYNRFFRTTLLGGLKFFFNDAEKIIVDSIYHDTEGNLETHDYFSWHSIFRINSDEKKVFFKNNQIKFIPSNPKDINADPVHTELIQFVDIILGAVTHCIDLSNSSNKGQNQAANNIIQLVERMMKKPRNKNSSYGYYKKYDICFFPQKKGYLDEENLPGLVYTGRKLALMEYLSGQKILDFFEDQ